MPPVRFGMRARMLWSLWHADDDLKGVDAVVVPGGFSYGDYLRSGAISALAPVMRSVIDARTRACRFWVFVTDSRFSLSPSFFPAR